MKFFSISTCLIIFLLFTQCIKEPETNGSNLVDDFDRKDMLENLSDNFIIPGYQNYLNKINELEVSVIAFEQNSSLNELEELQLHFHEGLIAWQKISFLEFGPAENIQLRSQSNIYPVDTTLINNNINNGTYDLAAISNLQGKGWQAMDFLLFKSGNSNSTLNYFSSNPDGITYLKDIITDLKSNANYVLNAWQSSYRQIFIENNANNASGSAVSDMSNAIIAHYETFIRKGKIGLPVGVFNGFSQAPMPYHVEGLFIESQLNYATTAMQYFKRFINGQHFETNEDGLGLLDYTNFVGALSGSENLSTAINAQIDRIIIANGLCIGSWSNFVQQSPSVSAEIYTTYQKLVPLIKVDLTSALGIIITYQDNDGD